MYAIMKDMQNNQTIHKYESKQTLKWQKQINALKSSYGVSKS